MTVQTHQPAYSAFNKFGLTQTVQALVERTKTLYLKDDIPWVIGYSGGKDSTAILQLVWTAVQELASETKAHKPVHVISTDTLVENPIVALWVERSLNQMRIAVKEQSLPIFPHRLTPKVEDRFWVNLVGRGYPAPRYKFRWCTDRLKISPSNTFIQEVVQKNGEAILVLGTRKHESTVRTASMENIESRTDNTRKNDGLNVNTQLDRVWVYTPVEDWTNDDVWAYLTKQKNPWGFKNTDLLGMYQGATEGGECPLVVDKSTPSCGDSRFGCYVCTMVGEDKSMAAMIANDDEKEWMLPLLELRNEIDINDANEAKKRNKIARDKSNRDFRRMNGNLTVHISMKDFSDSKELDESEDPFERIAQYEDASEFKYENLPADIVRGPYKQEFRVKMLKKILEAQLYVQQTGPTEVSNLELLTLEDLEEIRRLWTEEKNEVEDLVPIIYREVTGKVYPGPKRAHNPLINNDMLNKLKEFCKQFDDKDGLKYQQLRSLLAIEDRYKHQLRRAKISQDLESAIETGAFASIDDARLFALERSKNEYSIKLNRLEDAGNSNDYLNNIERNLQILDAKKELNKYKKYKQLLVELSNADSKNTHELATRLVEGLKKLYRYYIKQIDLSVSLLSQKKHGNNENEVRKVRLYKPEQIDVLEIKP
ncbi:DNA phosphorothioation system sulfurtransferase DndC [Shewanella algae]|uniref:DNA phosphorothioation system sulfurtransferase DndC n=1 Tax=Shewanella algae TaxID=38313 RepID=UPI001AAC6981|nr:DNA phosphorothioation system sulfurtransferase DndC [Shewanella algae]MBO2656618.1 DNA phosphorothioation system sulfurtransferase DndC [Shewanella algae]